MFQDYLRLLVIVGFVMVEDVEGVPLHRVSRHIGRDVIRSGSILY
jgi:hypothetical protein